MTRSFGSKQVSKAHNHAALLSVITMRRTLDGIDPGSLARSYGVAEPMVAEMIEAERRRRG